MPDIHFLVITTDFAGLTKLLSHANSLVAANAAAGLAQLAAVSEAYKDGIAAAGAIPQLVRH